LLPNEKTDLIGWYRQGAILGVIFTEVNAGADRPSLKFSERSMKPRSPSVWGRAEQPKSRFLFTFSRKFGTRINPVGRRTASSIRNLGPTASRQQVPLLIKRMMDIAVAPLFIGAFTLACGNCRDDQAHFKGPCDF